MEEGIVNIKQIAGVIEQVEVDRLRKLVFRATKGKALAYFQPIEQDDLDSDEEGNPDKRNT